VQVWDWRRAATVADGHVADDEIAQSGLTYSDDGRRILIAERSGTVFQVDAVSLEPVGGSVDVEGPIVQVIAGPGANTAIVLRESGGYDVVDLDEGRVLDEGDLGLMPGFGDVSPDGRRLAIVDPDGHAGLFDLESGDWLQPPHAAHQSFGTGWTIPRTGRTSSPPAGMVE
jgi:hypothetical protein